MSIASVALNSSAHTFGDLSTLAQQAPVEAETYLRNLATNLKGLNQAAPAAAIEALLAQTGNLVERLAANSQSLTQVFPQDAAGWGALQAARVNTIGYTVTDQADIKPQYLKGTVTDLNGAFTLTTPGGKSYALAESNKVTDTNMPRSFMGGLITDGAVSLQGSLGQDGKSFNVEGFALNRDGKYDTFTFGRVVIDGELATISTPRGSVAITDPELQKKLKLMPRLGVILPGDSKSENGKLVYDQNPEKFFGLARFRETAVRVADAVSSKPYVLTDMAYSIFSGKPCTIPPGSEARVSHYGRLWAEGTVELDVTGAAARFDASYISLQTDATYNLMGAFPDADPIQAAVMMTEA